MIRSLKNIITIGGTLLSGVVMLHSCKYSPYNSSNGEGNLSVELSTSSETIIGTPSTKAAEPIYKVEIVNSKGEAVNSYEDHTQLPSSIKLEEGQYTVKVNSGDPKGVGFDKPSYYGEAQTSITAGKNSSASVTAQLNNVVFVLDLDDKMLSGFTKTDLVISDNEGTELFTITKADVGKMAYLPVCSGYKWRLNLTNTQGENHFSTGEIKTVEPRNRFDMKFKVAAPLPETEGMFRLNIMVDKNLEEYEHILGVVLDNPTAPEISYQGNFTGGQVVVVNEKTRGKEVRYNFKVTSVLKEAWFFHQITTLDAIGIPRAIKLNSISDDVRAKLKAEGIEFSTSNTGVLSSFIDISGFCNKYPIGTYTMRYSVEDTYKQYLMEPITVSIMPDQDHIVTSAVVWARFADVEAQWFTNDRPAGLTVEYKTEQASVWSKAPIEDCIYNDAQKTFKVKLKALNANTKYLYRSVSDNKVGVEYNFVTDNVVEIPNLDFQTWSYGGGGGNAFTGRVDTWYPNSSATNYDSFWSTGNEGTGMNQAAKKSITYPEDDPTYGKVVKMESVFINGIVKTFAAGNLFTGYFKVNMSNTIVSAKMGRSYTGRPLGLRGKVKYISKTINKNYGGGSFDQYIGKADQGHIFFKLEDWGNGDLKPENFGDGSNQPGGVTKIPIAYGEYVINDTGGQWVDFEIRLNYTDLNRKPTHVTSATSSSIYGENFCGGEGSTLWITDYELIWE